jgi:hypothetical protein
MSDPGSSPPVSRSPRLPSRHRWLIVEGLLCWFALLAVAVLADSHSGYVLLATLPAIMFGLLLFLLHWLLPGTSSPAPQLRILRRSWVPLLCALLAIGFWRQAVSRGAPESHFRAVTGIPLPVGISNLHTKLLFGPTGGGGVVYFEGPPSVMQQLIERHELEADPFYNNARPHVPAEIPQPLPLAWLNHRSPSGVRPGRSHLQVFSSTNSPGVYVFTYY